MPGRYTKGTVGMNTKLPQPLQTRRKGQGIGIPITIKSLVCSQGKSAGKAYQKAFSQTAISYRL